MKFSKINVQSVIKFHSENQIRVNFNPWDLEFIKDGVKYHISRPFSLVIRNFEYINLSDTIYLNGFSSDLQGICINNLFENYDFKKTILDELEKNNIFFITDEEISELYHNDIIELNYDIMIFSLKEKIEQSLIKNNKENFIRYTDELIYLEKEKNKLKYNKVSLTEHDKKDMDLLFNHLETLLEESNLNVLIDNALLNKDKESFNKYTGMKKQNEIQ